MARLATPTATAEVIKKYGFSFQKKYGQNFLIDANILAKIINSSEITKEDYVIEIGPGIGTMTQYLAENAKEVVTVEIDKKLLPILRETLSGYDNITIINEDILKIDINKLSEDKKWGRPVKVVANLPYYITTPIIMGLFENHVPLKSITVMVQKEVADRMQAGPGTKDYGALSLAVQYYAKPQVVANVSPSCFMPRPKVGSSVIKLVKFDEPAVRAADEKKLFSIIHAAFSQRRKTLANALSNSSSMIDNNGKQVKVTREEVISQLGKMGLGQNIRGEALSLKQFVELCNLLSHDIF